MTTSLDEGRNCEHRTDGACPTCYDQALSEKDRLRWLLTDLQYYTVKLEPGILALLKAIKKG